MDPLQPILDRMSALETALRRLQEVDSSATDQSFSAELSDVRAAGEPSAAKATGETMSPTRGLSQGAVASAPTPITDWVPSGISIDARPTYSSPQLPSTFRVTDPGHQDVYPASAIRGLPATRVNATTGGTEYLTQVGGPSIGYALVYSSTKPPFDETIGVGGDVPLGQAYAGWAASATGTSIEPRT